LKKGKFTFVSVKKYYYFINFFVIVNIESGATMAKEGAAWLRRVQHG
jgi:hypothetical protein